MDCNDYTPRFFRPARWFWYIAFVILALARSITLSAYEPEVKDIDITVILSEDGSARITEVWDVVVAKGTEWYLVRENLGDMAISDLSVKDEKGHAFVNEGSWNVDRDIAQKARKCGLHKTDRGYEICWGVESYGPHKWVVSYTMSNSVKTLNDHDMLHMQFVSDELSSPPRHVHLSLRAPVPLSEANSNIWAFGFNGTDTWSRSGSVEVESEEAFEYDSSLILLIRFDKGIFNSPSVQERDFQEVLDRAREGSYFPGQDEDDEWYYTALGMLLFGGLIWLFIIRPIRKVLGFMGLRKTRDRKRIRNIFGVRRLPSKPDWYRDIPFKGDFLETYYIASHQDGIDDGKHSIVSAIILRMINAGVISIRTDENDKKEFVFNEAVPTKWMSRCEQSFLSLIKKASGEDKVLQEKEFNKWASTHRNALKSWVSEMKDEIREHFTSDSLLSGYTDKNASSWYDAMIMNDTGRNRAMKALGFKQFLKDFTIVNERDPKEVSLWGDYLVVAALFGIADRVAKEMKHIAPNVSIGQTSVPVSSISDAIILSNAFRSHTSSAANYISSSSGSSGSSGSYGKGSYGGFGGHSSHHGGGGFSSGGHGGGSR